MKIKAAILEEFGQPLEIQEIDLAEPKSGEVLVRLTACGVCHTDLYTASGADPSGYAPTVLGHEGAGIVEKLGPDVTSVAPGDHCVLCVRPKVLDVVNRDESHGSARLRPNPPQRREPGRDRRGLPGVGRWSDRS